MELRPFTEEDRSVMLEMLTDPKISQTYMIPDYREKSEAIPLFRRFWELSRNPDRFVRGIYNGKKLVGFLNDVEVCGSSVELGYVIHSSHWGKGYATAALKLAIEALFQRGFTEVITGAFQENPASLRVMEKAGMTLLDKQDVIEYRGVDHICIYYHITQK